MGVLKKRFFACIVLVLLLFLMICILEEHGRKQLKSIFKDGVVTIYDEDGVTDSYTASGRTIVIDAGHGGVDPGKVSIAGTEEKDINLSLALKLKEVLETDGYKVVLTRAADEDTCEGEYTKNGDLKKRVEIINSCDAEFVVSIHQNSYPDSSIHGAQVFYYSKSEEGKNMAECIQNSLLTMDSSNTRKAKSNDSYYLFRYTKCPTVIVECGFLSNPDEEALLMSEEYQTRMVQAIRNGIMQHGKNFQKNAQN